MVKVGAHLASLVAGGGLQQELPQQVAGAGGQRVALQRIQLCATHEGEPHQRQQLLQGWNAAGVRTGAISGQSSPVKAVGPGLAGVGEAIPRLSPQAWAEALAVAMEAVAVNCFIRTAAWTAACCRAPS